MLVSPTVSISTTRPMLQAQAVPPRRGHAGLRPVMANHHLEQAWGGLTELNGSVSIGDRKGSTPIVKTMVFDGRNLVLKDAQGNVIKTFPATSGKPGSTTDQTGAGDKQARKEAKNYGPIPQGSYSFQAGNYGPHGLARQRRFGEDWGSHGVRLTPEPGTNTHGRTNFWIHGGRIPGSAGCIDVGPHSRELHELLKNSKGKITLKVQYAGDIRRKGTPSTATQTKEQEAAARRDLRRHRIGVFLRNLGREAIRVNPLIPRGVDRII